MFKGIPARRMEREKVLQDHPQEVLGEIFKNKWTSNRASGLETKTEYGGSNRQ